MKITLHPYRLEFIFPFRIAHGIRTHTDAVFVELELDGVTAFGEATLPPYLPYTQESTMKCLSLAEEGLATIGFPFVASDVLDHFISTMGSVEPPALAAADMALLTLEAKMKGTTVAAILGVDTVDTAIRTYTISVCDKTEMRDRLAFGREQGFTTFKLKLNGVDDSRMLSDFFCLSDAPFAVDANQSWTNAASSIAFAKELATQGCLLIEQPFDKSDVENTRMLRDSISIPIIADEACQSMSGIDGIATAFSGVNVKLQKCGGLLAAKQMIDRAKGKGLKVLIGCMSESAIGCDAADALSPLCDWNDLDGKYLVKEVPFKN